jgi:excisionase family DNA binding protein
MNEQQLQTVDEAARALRVSKTYLYKLPKMTPGIYRFGRSVRYDVEKLRAWASTGQNSK